MGYAEVVGSKRPNDNTFATDQAADESKGNKKVCVRADAEAAIESEAREEKAPVGDCRCVVCMDDFETEDVVLLLPCKHYFHQLCTEGWLKVINRIEYLQ